MSRRFHLRTFVFGIALWCALLFVCVNARAQTTSPNGAPQARAQKPVAPLRLSVEEHRRELVQTLQQLKKWQRGALPTFDQLRDAMPPERVRDVRRRDGAQMKTSYGDWSRKIDNLEYSRTTSRLRRSDVRTLQRVFTSRLRALDEWSQSDYASSEAQNIVRSLENSNQISTQAPRFLVWWQTAKDAVGDWFNRLFSWRPATPTPANAPAWKANPAWINFFFASTLAALLVVIAWWLWRTFGGQWTRNASRHDLVFSGEDAELLLLPPDELRARAEHLAGEGLFGQALRHRYVAILLTLDSRKVWRYDTRRTNWEHIDALRKKRETQHIVAPLSALTERFDRVRYGEMTCTASDWSRFAQDATTLETLTSSTRDSSTRDSVQAAPATKGVAV